MRADTGQPHPRLVGPAAKSDDPRERLFQVKLGKAVLLILTFVTALPLQVGRCYTGLLGTERLRQTYRRCGPPEP